MQKIPSQNRVHPFWLGLVGGGSVTCKKVIGKVAESQKTFENPYKSNGASFPVVGSLFAPELMTWGFLNAKGSRFLGCTGDFFDTEGVDPVT